MAIFKTLRPIMQEFKRSVVRPSMQYQICGRCYHLVTPQTVSREQPVPSHIPRPPYIKQSFLQSLRRKVWKPQILDLCSIDKLQDSCSLARDVLIAAGEKAVEGVTTDDLDRFVHEMAIKNNAYPSPLMYKGFPKSVCTSVNNVACHGIPDDRPLVDGDIINIDITVYYNGFHGDTSATFMIGSVDAGGQRLVEVAKKCRDEAIECCGPGIPLFSIGNTISQVSESHGLDVIADFCGHGIGEYFHGPPDIVHVANEFKGVMEEGMAFTIEPVLTEGEPSIRILDDGWTAVSKDNGRSAQFEHTLLITSNGAEILT